MLPEGEAHGATEAEIQEAIAYAAEVRLWSTTLNGSQADLAEWQKTIDGILAHVSEAPKSNWAEPVVVWVPEGLHHPSA